jgi:hypothetical protein
MSMFSRDLERENPGDARNAIRSASGRGQ